MSELTAAQLRERLNERKRLNLSESRALIHILDQQAAAVRQHHASTTTTPPADLDPLLNEPVPAEIRTAVEDEQRRIYLQAGQLLFERLDALQAALPAASLAPATDSPAPPPTLELPANLPPALHDALLQIQHHPDLHDQQSIVGAVHAWCQEWLNVRAHLLDVAHTATATDHTPQP